MRTIFEKIQQNTKYIEQQSNFERFFSRFDIQNQRYEKPQCYNGKSPFEKTWRGGIPLSWNEEQGYVYTEHADSHTLIIGPTASKKSRLIVMPAVRMLGIAKESMIISDPKSEIYHRTAGFLRSEGYNIMVLNLRNPKRGSFWNPLAVPYQLYLQGDIDRAYEFINDIAINLTTVGNSENEPFWDNSAGTFFAGLSALLFKYCKDFNQPASVVHIGSILQLRNILCSGSKDAIMRNPLWNYAKTDLFITSALIGTLETANDTRAGILSTFDQKMRMFSTQPSLLNMLSLNEIEYDEIDEKPTALFLIMPDEKTTYHGLVSLFIKQSYEYLIYKAQKYNNNHDVRLKIRLNYVLDEFSSLPTVRDFPAMITAARSSNIRFNIVIQSKHQLFLRYRDDTETILSNCTHWIFLTSRELKFLEEISALCGKKVDREIESPVISVSVLQRFNKERGEVLILSRRFKPYLTRLPDIEMYDNNMYKEVSEYAHRVVKTEIVHVEMQKIVNRLKEDVTVSGGISTVQDAFPYFVNEPQTKDLTSLIDDRINESMDNDLIDKKIAEIEKMIEELEKEEKKKKKKRRKKKKGKKEEEEKKKRKDN